MLHDKGSLGGQQPNSPLVAIRRSSTELPSGSSRRSRGVFRKAGLSRAWFAGNPHPDCTHEDCGRQMAPREAWGEAPVA